MADGQILSVPDGITVPRPQPVQVQAPAAVQAASMAPEPDKVQMRQAADNFAESRNAIMHLNDANLKALAGLSPVISDKLQEMDNAEFARGYMAQTQSESVQRLAEEQPDGGFFGDGMAVRGARAAQQQQQAAQLNFWVENNAGKLAQMTPDEQMMAIGKFVSDMGTGDEVADMNTAMALQQRMPMILEKGVRLAAAEAQRSAEVSQADTQRTAGMEYQQATKDLMAGNISQNSFDQMVMTTAQAFKPLPHQTTESFLQNTASSITEMAKSGEFQLATMIQKDVFNAVATPAERAKMDVMMEKARAEYRLNNPLAQNSENAIAALPNQIGAMTFATKEDLNQYIDNLNADDSRNVAYGKPRIDNEVRGKLLAMWDKAKEQSAKVDLKEYEQQAKVNMFIDRMAAGDVAGMQASGADSLSKNAVYEDQAAKVFGDNEQTAQNSFTVLGKLAFNGEVNPQVKQRLNSVVSMIKQGIPPSEEDAHALKLFVTRAESKRGAVPVIMDSYFGEDSELVQKWSRIDPNSKQSLAVFNQQQTNSKLIAQVTPDEKLAAQEAVDDYFQPGWVDRIKSVFGGEDHHMGLGESEDYRERVAQQYLVAKKTHPHIQDAEQLMDIAMANTNKETSFIGSNVVVGAKPGSLQTELNKHLRVPISDMRSTVVHDAAIRAVRSKAPFAKDAPVTGIRALPNGMLFASVQGPTGFREVPFMVSDIAAVINGDELQKQKANQEAAKRDRLNREQQQRNSEAYVQAVTQPFIKR